MRPQTNQLELEYVRRMMAWLLAGATWTLGAGGRALHAVQLGLGAAALTRFCLHSCACARLSEINEA